MPVTPCPACGAPGDGFICAYCGAALHEPGDERAEIAALDQYHRHLEAVAANPDQCSRMIAQGYVPTGRKALIEAGMRCLPSIDVTTPYGACQEQWLTRLKLIVTRLRVTHPGDDTKSAIEEFNARMEDWRKKDAKDTRDGCLFFIFIGLVLVLLAWWLLRRFIS